MVYLIFCTIRYIIHTTNNESTCLFTPASCFSGLSTAGNMCPYGGAVWVSVLQITSVVNDCFDLKARENFKLTSSNIYRGEILTIISQLAQSKVIQNAATCRR